MAKSLTGKIAEAARSMIPSRYIDAKVRRDPKTGALKLAIDPRKLKRPRKENFAAGFYDEYGGFHPIRASFDYVASRVGEKKRYAKGGGAEKRAQAARRAGLKAAKKRKR